MWIYNSLQLYAMSDVNTYMDMFMHTCIYVGTRKLEGYLAQSKGSDGSLEKETFG